MFNTAKILFILVILFSSILTSCSSTKIPLADAKQDYSAHDYSQAFNKLLKPATQGNPEAQYAIGYMYYYGLGIAKDQDIARVWITKSATRHYLPAVLAINEIYKVNAKSSFHSLN